MTRKETRIQWMLDNQMLWEGWPLVSPNNPQNRTADIQRLHIRVANQMKQAGLYSKSTRPMDIQVGLYVYWARLRIGVFN